MYPHSIKHPTRKFIQTIQEDNFFTYIWILTVLAIQQDYLVTHVRILRVCVKGRELFSCLSFEKKVKVHFPSQIWDIVAVIRPSKKTQEKPERTKRSKI